MHVVDNSFHLNRSRSKLCNYDVNSIKLSKMLNSLSNSLGNSLDNQDNVQNSYPLSNKLTKNNHQGAEKIVIANWKMNGDKNKIELFLLNLLKTHSLTSTPLKTNSSQINSPQNYPSNTHNSVKTILALPYPYLLQSIQYIKNYLSTNHLLNSNNSNDSNDSNVFFNNPVNIAAQNCSQHNNGPYTGEVSASMLNDIDCNYVILGHTERRRHFHENNETIREKYIAALKHNIQPILCIGESTKENFKNEVNEQLNAVSDQFISISALSNNNSSDISNDSSEKMKKMEILIAYEPAWAIGTGVTPTLDEIENRITYIKNVINHKINHKISEIISNNDKNSSHNDTVTTNQHMQSIKILYGGSVNENNIEEIIKIKEISGVLVGNASLIFENFFEILSKVNFFH